METQGAFMAAAAAAVLVVAVLIRRRDLAGLLLGAVSLAFGAWTLGRGAAGLGLPWGPPLERSGLSILGPLALGFAWILGAPVPRYALLLPATLVGGIAIAVAPFTATSWHRTLDLLPPVWAGALVTGAAVLLLRRPRVGPQAGSPEFTRLGYVATSHLLVVVAAGADAVLGLLSAPRGGVYFAALLYLYIAHLHLSHVRVADLRQLFGNTLALTLMAATLAGFFAALHLWVGQSLDLFVLNAFLACFVLLLFHEPLRRTVQYAMDRWLVRDKIALARSLAALGSRLGKALTLDQLLREFLRSLERTERVTSSSIFLCDDPRMGFQLAASIGLSPRARVNLIREPEFVAALERRELLLREDLERDEETERGGGAAESSGMCLRVLADLDAQLVIPLRTGSNLVGFWTLTDANSAEPFSTEEARLLRELADTAAISIEQSKTFERIRARDRLVALGEMAAGLAHEIRNPIATIRGALDLLDEPGKSDETEIRRLVVEEVARLNRVVGLFLDYARPSPSRRTPQDPRKVLERAVTESRPLHGETGSVVLEVEPDLPAVPLDGEQLERVISNLVRNAREATGPDGTVRISARTDRGDHEEPAGIEVLIEDDGPGMDEETLSRAFVPFFTTKERGVGLGLALCERLVRAQGGRIDIRSEPGRGTRARVWVPASPVEAEHTEQPEA